MAYQNLGPFQSESDALNYTETDAAQEIFCNDVLPGIADVATKLIRRGERSTRPEVYETASKMLDMWQEVFDLLHKRVYEEYPEIGQLEERVRDAGKW